MYRFSLMVCLLAAASGAVAQTIGPVAPAAPVDLASLPAVIQSPVIPTAGVIQGPTVVLPAPVVLPPAPIVLPPIVQTPATPVIISPPVVLPPVLPVQGPTGVVYPMVPSYPGRLGVALVDHQPEGARVVRVWLDSPAARLRDLATGQLCRLDPGDVILAADGIQVQSAAHLAQLIQKAGDRMVLTVRDCWTGRIAHLLAELPQSRITIRIPIPPVESRKIFPALQVAQVRRRAEQARQIRGPLVGEGWIPSPTDPMDLVAVFGTLKVREPYRLVAHVLDWGGGWSGRVVAVPSDAKWPASDPARGIPANVPGLVEDPMEVIQGDGSAWSYLEASILQRELREFGAEWHGRSWSTHTILGANPLRVPGAKTIPPHSDEHHEDFGKGQLPWPGDEGWRWFEPAMNDPAAQWDPVVYISPNLIRVVFYTYSPLGQEGIYRHEDVYRPGHYRPVSTTMTQIAEGPRYMVF
ncbi:MAG: PDZ domain-containing protein [Thermoguttaceae bacterium]|nr:PDZ domain-containing protein [Thermoguttaceae bacterium]MDW8038146.1 PDZ domain-containing protein [Thermoguttaceae bacterium]